MYIIKLLEAVGGGGVSSGKTEMGRCEAPLSI